MRTGYLMYNGFVPFDEHKLAFCCEKKMNTVVGLEPLKRDEHVMGTTSSFNAQGYEADP